MGEKVGEKAVAEGLSEMIVLGKTLMANGWERKRRHSRELWSAAPVVLL